MLSRIRAAGNMVLKRSDVIGGPSGSTANSKLTKTQIVPIRGSWPQSSHSSCVRGTCLAIHRAVTATCLRGCTVYQQTHLRGSRTAVLPKELIVYQAPHLHRFPWQELLSFRFSHLCHFHTHYGLDVMHWGTQLIFLIIVI